MRSNPKINSIRFLNSYSNVTIIDDITKLDFFGRETLLVPWQDNLEEFRLKVSNKNTSCEICIGHFPINGFYMNAKKVCTDEIDSETFFNNFKVTFSGHFHNRDLKKKGDSYIRYSGSPFHLNRNDSNAIRGFDIFDFETLKYESIDNHDSIRYLKVKYPEDYSKVPIEGNIIDVDYFYDSNSVEEDFQAYLKGIQDRNPLYPPFPKRINNSMEETKEDVILESKSNRSILTEFVSKTVIDTEQKEILEKLDDLYNECIKGDMLEQ
jgi:DNA repair exonuclease SbcCD nuclease subunit